MNEIAYIAAGLIAWISGLYVIRSVITAKHGKRNDNRTVKQAVADASKAKVRTEEMADEMALEIEKLKQKQTLFEESLQSFTNRLSARAPRKKDESTEEQLAKELARQNEELNGGQTDLEFPEQNGGRRRLVPLNS